MGGGEEMIPPRKKHKVLQRFGFACADCNRTKDEVPIEVDHIVPVAKGGGDDYDNLQALCYECNMKKRDKIINHCSNLSPKKKLKKLKSFLSQNLDCTINEIRFLVLNDSELHHFNFNLNLLQQLFDEANGRGHNNFLDQKYLVQRNALLKCLSDLGYNGVQIAEELSKRGWSCTKNYINQILRGSRGEEV